MGKPSVAASVAAGGAFCAKRIVYRGGTSTTPLSPLSSGRGTSSSASVWTINLGGGWIPAAIAFALLLSSTERSDSTLNGDDAPAEVLAGAKVGECGLDNGPFVSDDGRGGKRRMSGLGCA